MGNDSSNNFRYFLRNSCICYIWAINFGNITEVGLTQSFFEFIYIIFGKRSFSKNNINKFKEALSQTDFSDISKIDCPNIAYTRIS